MYNFKTGDIVIKNSGGNKMTIHDKISETIYKCYYFVDNGLNIAEIDQSELMPINAYNQCMERMDKIDYLFKFGKRKSTI